MIVDTSAIIAMLLDEPESPAVQELLLAQGARIPAPILTEMLIVARARRGEAGVRAVEAILAAADATVEPIDASLARSAAEAYSEYGRGSRTPAKLNYGDCFSYALARSADEPLLFVGDDFAHTDVRDALEEFGSSVD